MKAKSRRFYYSLSHSVHKIRLIKQLTPLDELRQNVIFYGHLKGGTYGERSGSGGASLKRPKPRRTFGEETKATVVKST